MHWLEFPSPQKLKVGNPPEWKVVEYRGFLDDNVWCDPRWRQNADWARARNRLIALFDAAFDAGKRGVGIVDKDYEKWELIASMRGFTMPPENVRPISHFTDAAMFAETTEPEWAKEPPTEPAALPGKTEAPALPPATAS